MILALCWPMLLALCCVWSQWEHTHSGNLIHWECQLCQSDERSTNSCQAKVLTANQGKIVSATRRLARLKTPQTPRPGRSTHVPRWCFWGYLGDRPLWFGNCRACRASRKGMWLVSVTYVHLPSAEERNVQAPSTDITGAGFASTQQLWQRFLQGVPNVTKLSEAFPANNCYLRPGRQASFFPLRSLAN